MFTGIVETTGEVLSATKEGGNAVFWVKSSLSGSLSIDQSISHNGICLTVDALEPDKHRVTAVAETLSKTNAGNWQSGHALNLERCMMMNGRLDGHIVQGHVDDTATCTAITPRNGSWEYQFTFTEKHAPLLIEKGSVCIDGISLTAFNVTRNSFTVAIIPYTYKHTNIQYLQVGNSVNIEFDIIGKYLHRLATLNH